MFWDVHSYDRLAYCNTERYGSLGNSTSYNMVIKTEFFKNYFVTKEEEEVNGAGQAEPWRYRPVRWWWEAQQRQCVKRLCKLLHRVDRLLAQWSD